MIDQRYRELAGAAEEAARQPDFASVRHRARRHKTRRRAGGAAAAAILAAAGVTGVALVRPTGDTPFDPSAASGHVLTADAADAEHVYAITADCDECPRLLVASDDGGRTWEERRVLDAAAGTVSVTALGPEVLLLTWARSRTDGSSDDPVDPSGSPPPSDAASSAYLPGGVTRRAVSVDGGRTLRDLELSEAPVAAAAPGTRLVDCLTVWLRPGQCAVYAVDPESGRLARLANQPPLDARSQPDSPYPIDLPVSAGLWVSGSDPATGRPAIAVSRDQGRTWRTAVFEDETAEAVSADVLGMFPGPAVATTDGRLVYVVFAGPETGRVAVYRSSDGGESFARTRGEFPRDGVLLHTSGMVTADGTHVLPGGGGSGFRYLGSQGGDRYTPIVLRGLPARDRAPRAITARFYLYQAEGELYTSTDGRDWRRALG